MMMSKKKEIEDFEENLGEKKALLIGLKHPRVNDNSVKVQILRMKKLLMDLQGFSEDNITLLIEDDDEESYTQPTDFNVRAESWHFIHRANPGDTLFIHLIAHCCSNFCITTSDKQFIPDCHFRALMTSIKKGCSLTIVSDCLFQPAENSVCCSRGIPADTPEDTEKFHIKHPEVKFIILGIMGFPLPTNLSPVDILKEETTTCITPILNKLSKSFIFRPPSIPNSSLVLLNAFQGDQRKAKKEAPPYGVPELFLPPPEVASSITNTHRLYGGFTTAILDIMEETQGQVTNVELAEKAMQKLRMQGIHQKPGLHCNDIRLAYAPFIG